MNKKILALSLVSALIGVLAVPLSAWAETGTSTVSGNIGTVYTITPGSSSVPIGPFALAQPYTSGNMTVDVFTNDSSMTHVTITVSDAKTNTKGLLTRGGTDSAGTGLTNPLTVKGGAVAAYTSLATDQTLRADVTPVSVGNVTDFSVQQTVTAADLSKTAGSYSLVLTFTATFAP